MPIGAITMPIGAITTPTGVITMPIYAITRDRSGRSRWAVFRNWTLNSVDAFSEAVPGKAKWSIGYGRAFATSRMSDLGDCAIATYAPLVFRFVVDPVPIPEELDEPMTASVIFRGVEIYARDRLLQHSAVQEFAYNLMMYGEWSEGEQEMLVQNGLLHGWQYSFSPIGPEAAASSDLSVIGMLSKIISRCYLDGAKNTIHSASVSPILEPGGVSYRHRKTKW
ncbi:hypothetical protein OV203_08815 [Nannocystis sp. ILAH1]|uniref:hypothetical protein n=1 Tax=Nannocystis sp. ILAH1 TaxID=2996789 RepID=UPI00226E0890|nr:hypothetical protein [Nannocystis sp. ILAH1]MCY0987222.1 hypothetical protein [Nannocystis sp. ILAH1]